MNDVDPQHVKAIYRYAHLMDIKRFDLVASLLAPECGIDYSAVGGPKGPMSPEQVTAFLTSLLGSAELRVHTAIQQVMPSDADEGSSLAYYSVKHFRRSGDEQRTFFVYGWYEFAMTDGLIDRLSIRVQAMSGEPEILGQ